MVSLNEGFRSGSLVVIDGEPRRAYGRPRQGRNVRRTKLDHHVLCFCEACGGTALLLAHRVHLRLNRTCGCAKTSADDTSRMHPTYELVEVLAPVKGKTWWRVRCKRCNHTRDRPAALMRRGSGCPRCFNKVRWNGQLEMLDQVSRSTGISVSTLRRRLTKRPDDADISPIIAKILEEKRKQAPATILVEGREVGVRELAKKLGVSRELIKKNYKLGLPNLQARGLKLRDIPPGTKVGDFSVIKKASIGKFEVKCAPCGRTLHVTRDTLRRGRCKRCNALRRGVTPIVVAGERLLLSEALRLFEISEATFYNRVRKLGMSVEEALITPKRNEDRSKRATLTLRKKEG